MIFKKIHKCIKYFKNNAAYAARELQDHSEGPRKPYFPYLHIAFLYLVSFACISDKTGLKRQKLTRHRWQSKDLLARRSFYRCKSKTKKMNKLQWIYTQHFPGLFSLLYTNHWKMYIQRVPMPKLLFITAYRWHAKPRTHGTQDRGHAGKDAKPVRRTQT